MSENEADETVLSPDTLAALTEFLNEKRNVNQLTCINEKHHISDIFEENWQLSQFWYDEKTTDLLVKGVINSTESTEKIALISCPSLYNRLKTNCGERKVVLLEYDERFKAYGSDYIHYDYNSPLVIPENLSDSIDLVVADPPFLSEECLTKVASTIKFLTNKRIVLCTGAVMVESIRRLLGLKKCNFVPTHKNNLANEFCCYSNFDFDKAINK